MARATMAAAVCLAVAGCGGGGLQEDREGSLAAKQCPPGPTIHESRTAFLSASTRPFTDDYATAYQAGTYSDAAMTAVKGETRYQSLSFTDINIVLHYGSIPDPAHYYYCAGCNGNFKLHFNGTSRSVRGTGVPSVAVDVVVHTSRHTSFGDPDPNEVSLPGTVVVEFGNGESMEISVPADVGYFGPQAFFIGLSDKRLIRSLTFGTEPLPDRHFWGIDNLTIAGKPKGPCP